MANIDRLDREAKEYFYSLPLSVQHMVVNSTKEITCREDIQRYFSSAVVTARKEADYGGVSAVFGESNAPISNSNLF